MASGDLFYPYPVRFSMKNVRHIELWDKLHDDELNRGKVKNQIVMDALEMYYNELFKKKDGREDRPCKEQFPEQQMEQLKKELREEMWQEMLGAVASGVLGGRPLSSDNVGKPEKKSTVEDGTPDNW